MAWRGDCTVLHPRFDMQAMLSSISKHKIERLYLVWPLLFMLFVSHLASKCETYQIFRSHPL